MGYAWFPREKKLLTRATQLLSIERASERHCCTTRRNVRRIVQLCTFPTKIISGSSRSLHYRRPRNPFLVTHIQSVKNKNIIAFLHLCLFIIAIHRETSCFFHSSIKTKRHRGEKYHYNKTLTFVSKSSISICRSNFFNALQKIRGACRRLISPKSNFFFFVRIRRERKSFLT